MAVRSQRFNAGSEIQLETMSQEFCHTQGAMLKVAVVALGPDAAFRCCTWIKEITSDAHSGYRSLSVQGLQR
jgi:hypothetical protein